MVNSDIGAELAMNCSILTKVVVMNFGMLNLEIIVPFPSPGFTSSLLTCVSSPFVHKIGRISFVYIGSV